MTLNQESIDRTRRDFLTSSASGLGMAALGAMLTADGVISASPYAGTSFHADQADSLVQHFAPKAKTAFSCFRRVHRRIWICLIRSQN